MNINDIMMRDMLAEDKRQRELAAARPERVAPTWGDTCGMPWLAIAMWVLVGLTGMGAAFTGGMWYQAERDRAADAADVSGILTGGECARTK